MAADGQRDWSALRRRHTMPSRLRPRVLIGRTSAKRACFASKADIDGMEDPPSPTGPIDLDALDDYLSSDHAPDDSMGLSDLDGFWTGIVVGPELILPTEWLPVVWGGNEPEFETEAEMRTVLGTIMDRYNEIVTCFDSNPDDFDPIFWEGPEGEVGGGRVPCRSYPRGASVDRPLSRGTSSARLRCVDLSGGAEHAARGKGARPWSHPDDPLPDPRKGGGSGDGVT
jgi:hypothetical protein